MPWPPLLASLSALALHVFGENGTDLGIDSESTDNLLFESAVQYFLSKHIESIVSFSCKRLDTQRLVSTASAASLAVRAVSPRPDQDLDAIHVRGAYTRVGLFLDISCTTSYSIIAQASDMVMFNATFYWFVWCPRRMRQELLRTLGRADLGVNSELVLSWPLNAAVPTGAIEFWDAYKLHSAGELRLARLGPPDWGSNTLDRRRNLTGLVVQVVSIVLRNQKPGWDQEEEFLDERVAPNDPNIYTRQSLRLLSVTRDLYNFTYRLRTASVGGAYLPNGSCTAMSGMLQRGESDYGTFLRLEIDRWNCMDYVFDTFKFFEIGMLHRLPVASSSTKGMARPFSGPTWAALGSTALLLAALLWLAGTSHDHEASWAVKASSSLLLTIAAVANTSVELDLLAAKHSTRAAYFAAVFGFTMLAGFYSSAIIRALVITDTRGGLPVQEIIDNNFRVIAEDYVLYRVFFRNYTNDPFLKELARRYLSTSSAYVKLSLAMQRVRAGHVALISDRNTLILQLEGKVMSESELCSLRFTRLSDKFLVQGVSRKNWPPKDLIARGLALMRERGLGRRISPVIETPCSGPDADAANAKEVSQLPVAACAVAFAVLGAGLASAAVAFLAELVSFWWSASQSASWQRLPPAELVRV